VYSCEGSESRGTMPEFLVRFYHDLQSHVMGEVAPFPLQACLADEVEVLSPATPAISLLSLFSGIRPSS